MRKKQASHIDPNNSSLGKFFKGVALKMFDAKRVYERFSQLPTVLLIITADHPSSEVRKSSIYELGRRKEPEAEVTLIRKCIEWKNDSDAFAAVIAMGCKNTIPIDLLLIKLAENHHCHRHFMMGVMEILDKRINEANKWTLPMIKSFLLNHSQDKLRFLAIRKIAREFFNSNELLMEIALKAKNISDRAFVVELLAEMDGTIPMEKLLFLMEKHQIAAIATPSKDLEELCIHTKAMILWTVKKREHGLKTFLGAINTTTIETSEQKRNLYEILVQIPKCWDLAEVRSALRSKITSIENLARHKLFCIYKEAKAGEKDLALEMIHELTESDNYSHWEPAMRFLKDLGLIKSTR